MDAITTAVPAPTASPSIWSIPAAREAGGCAPAAFYGTGRLSLNGRDAGAVNGDYLGLDIDVTRLLRTGVNQLGCRLTNRCARHVLPGIDDPDFLLYGGLAGKVWLEFLPTLHWVEGELSVVSEDLPDGATAVTVEAPLENATRRARQVSLRWEVWEEASGRGAGAAALAVDSACELPPGATRLCRLTLVLPRALRWSPATPRLYLGRLSACAEDGESDAVRRTFGVRRLEWQPNRGFFLDGQHIALRGCNRHEQLPGFGNALPSPFHRLDAQAIRAAGLNFVRLSHYPQSPDFLDACDRLGVLAMPELATWKSVRGGRWLAAARRQFARLVRRDRHHPSVILWCLGNESRHRRAFVQLDALAKQLDPERRATLYAENHLHRARRRRTLGLTDVWGANYELDRLAEGRAAARLRCIVVTECANLPHSIRGDLAAEAEQRNRLAADLAKVAAAADGFAVWSFNDYATLRKRRYMRHCGILDGWREPKMTACWLAAIAHERPVLTVWCDWSYGGPDRRSARIVTNCERLERVSVPVWPPPRENGGLDRSSSRQALDVVAAFDGVYDLELPFDGAPLRLCGTWRGRPVACCVEPWGPAVDVRLHLEALEHDDAEETRLGVVNVQVVDADGHAVRDFLGEAEARLSGDARAALLAGRTVPVRAGTARIILTQQSPQPAPVRVQVGVAGLPWRNLVVDWDANG